MTICKTTPRHFAVLYIRTHYVMAIISAAHFRRTTVTLEVFLPITLFNLEQPLKLSRHPSFANTDNCTNINNQNLLFSVGRERKKGHDSCPWSWRYQNGFGRPNGRWHWWDWNSSSVGGRRRRRRAEEEDDEEEEVIRCDDGEDEVLRPDNGVRTKQCLDLSVKVTRAM